MAFYDVHIDPRWKGTVAVSLPLHKRGNGLIHDVGGVWLAEGTHLGERTVWLTQLSWLTTIFTKAKDKITGTLCLDFNIDELEQCILEKVGNYVDGKLVSWIEARLPQSCVAQMAEAGITASFGGSAAGVIAILKASQSGKCVGQAGESGYKVPTGPVAGTKPGSGGRSSGGGGGSSGGGGGSSGGGGSAGTSTYAETTGSVANTWTDYADAGGSQGPQIAANQTVQIACWVTGFQVADGNTYWYKIASSPWDGAYYVSADAFYNNGATSGSLNGTPFVDSAVPSCSNGSGGSGGGSKPTYAETTGSVAHTRTDYQDAGGSEGPEIASNQTVQIACWVTGFQVADGNTYWYEVASSPWDGEYYVSADAFYNNGQISGSLQGTPFIDPAVPQC